MTNTTEKKSKEIRARIKKQNKKVGAEYFFKEFVAFITIMECIGAITALVVAVCSADSKDPVYPLTFFVTAIICFVIVAVLAFLYRKLENLYFREMDYLDDIINELSDYYKKENDGITSFYNEMVKKGIITAV